MKNYMAFVTDRFDGKKFIFKSSDFGCRSRKEFIEDLHSNGYSIHRVEIEEVYDYVLENTNCEKVDYEAARLAYRAGKLDGLSRTEFAEYRAMARERSFARLEARISALFS